MVLEMKTEGGAMRISLCAKKIYCSACGRLIRCREQKNNGKTNVLCTRCGKLLRVWDGIRWRYVKEGA